MAESPTPPAAQNPDEAAANVKKQYWRVPFYILLGVFFAVAAFLKQFSILPPGNPIPMLLAAFSFCGTIGLLSDYAYRIKYTIFWLIPGLTALEFFGDLVYNANMLDVAKVIYSVSALIWPVYGLLFIVKGGKLLATDRGVGIKMIVLGILTIPVLAWEYVTYYPQQYDPSHWAWRFLYLAIFAWLLVIDWTTDFSKRPSLKVQAQILRVSMVILTIWYFVRFIFK